MREHALELISREQAGWDVERGLVQQLDRATRNYYMHTVHLAVIQWIWVYI